MIWYELLSFYALFIAIVFGTNYFGRIGWEIFANNCCVYIAFRQKEMLPGFPSMRH